MAEIITSFFKSWFHCFDATVILAGFIVDVCLKNGTLRLSMAPLPNHLNPDDSYFICPATSCSTSLFMHQNAGNRVLRGLMLIRDGPPVLEEAGSIVIVLRLWRVFKIIEEFSAGAEEQMEALSERVESLEKENQGLRLRLRESRTEGGSYE